MIKNVSASVNQALTFNALSRGPLNRQNYSHSVNGSLRTRTTESYKNMRLAQALSTLFSHKLSLFFNKLPLDFNIPLHCSIFEIKCSKQFSMLICFACEIKRDKPRSTDFHRSSRHTEHCKPSCASKSIVGSFLRRRISDCAILFLTRTP